MRGSVQTACVMMFCALCAACSTHHEEPSQGGETHFLSACEESSECGALSCICGFCTRRCDANPVCEALHEAARCAAVASSCGDDAPAGPVCAIATDPEVDASAHDDAAAASDDGGVDSGACSDPDCGASLKPLVFFVVDSSGSMERITDCPCVTPSCDECLPDCGPGGAQRNRWTQVLEALTGTYEDDFQCEEYARKAPLFSYDVGYYLPYHAPDGTQREDGVLDVFVDRARFGIATFDSWDTMLGYPPLVGHDEFDPAISEGEAGLWSYPPGGWTHPDGTKAGDFRYPSCIVPYRMDTGIRSAAATEGQLLVAHDELDAEAIAKQAQTSLLATRPYGGTPIASALDALYYYLAHDPAAAAERDNPMRKRHVVLITDGYPDDDYRSFNCNCAAEVEGDCGSSPPNDPAMMVCPYPTPEDAAMHLVCGYGFVCEPGMVDAVHVVGFDIDDEIVIDRLDSIASAGNTSSARFAAGSSDAELSDVLHDLVQEISSPQ